MDASAPTFEAATESRVSRDQRPSASGEAAETAHLRRLLEIQPECLFRVGRDGLLLACNEAGLGLLGKEDLAQVLNRPCEEHLAAGHFAAWRAFLEQVWTTGAGSFECDLSRAADATSRTAQFKAVALRDHPDGIESILVAVRDIDALRLLEPALRTAGELRARLDTLQHELHRLEGERDSAEAARAIAEQTLQHALDRTRQAEQSAGLERAEHDAVAAERAHAAAEQERLAYVVEQLGEQLRRMSADHDAGYATIARELQETRSDSAAQHEQFRQALADADARYAEALVELTATRNRTEPAAATGRLAQHLSRELHSVIATLDERLQLLLSSTRTDLSNRPMIEAVQADALRAAALVRQLCPTRPEGTATPETI